MKEGVTVNLNPVQPKINGRSQLRFPLKIGLVTFDPHVTQTNFAFYSKALYEHHAFPTCKLFIKFALSVLKIFFSA